MIDFIFEGASTIQEQEDKKRAIFFAIGNELINEYSGEKHLSITVNFDKPVEDSVHILFNPSDDLYMFMAKAEENLKRINTSDQEQTPL